MFPSLAWSGSSIGSGVQQLPILLCSLPASELQDELGGSRGCSVTYGPSLSDAAVTCITSTLEFEAERVAE
jgi:hypothetical protein